MARNVYWGIAKTREYNCKKSTKKKKRDVRASFLYTRVKRRTVLHNLQIGLVQQAILARELGDCLRRRLMMMMMN